jgi:hypothetical protein
MWEYLETDFLNEDHLELIFLYPTIKLPLKKPNIYLLLRKLGGPNKSLL